MELQPRSIGSIREVEEYTPGDRANDDDIEALGLEDPPEGIHPLDTEEVRRRFSKVSSWFAQERARQAEFRMESMLDHEFYDGPGQWTQEEKNVLAKRAQLPITFNQIKPTVDWVIGTEKKVRVDYRVLPRGEEDAKAAETKTKLFKYISDANNAGYKRSKSFADAVLAGVGWIDHGISNDPDDEPLRVSYEDWRYVWWDTLAVEDDLSDARYIFRGKWVDLDVACAMFPQRSDVLKASVIEGNIGLGYETFLENSDPSFDPKMAGGMPYNAATGNTIQYTGFFGYIGAQVAIEPRDRVFLIECQYRVPVVKKVLKSSIASLNGITFMQDLQAHQDLVTQGIGNPVEYSGMEMRQMIFTGDSVLQDGESPYRHKRFSLVPIWGFKRKKDGTPYGIVRNLRDPQKDLNKRRSKALYLMSANRVLADDDAIDNTDQTWADIVQEANRPDGLIKMNPKSGRGITISNENKMAEEHVMMMTQDEKYIQSSSGVTDELMGRDTNAVSGKAIRARQEQGGVVTTAFFDNHRLAFKLSGEIILSMIEQLYTDEKKVRITGGENGQQAEFLSINSIDPMTGEKIGDITATQADFVISEQDYSATIRQAMFDSLTDMIKTMDPNAAMSILDLVFEMSDLPGKEKFVDRLRKITGQRGSENVPTPEDLAADQQKAEEAAQQGQLQNAILQTELAAEQAKVKKLEQEAQLIAAKIRTESVNQQVKASGVDYDKEKLRMEKAAILNEIEQAEHAREVENMQPENSPAMAEQDMEIKQAQAAQDMEIKNAQTAHDLETKNALTAHEMEHRNARLAHEKTIAERKQATLEADHEHAHAHTDKMGEHQRKIAERDQVMRADTAKFQRKMSTAQKLVKHSDTAGRSVERGLKSNNRK
jgi:hypothetical protein